MGCWEISASRSLTLVPREQTAQAGELIASTGGVKQSIATESQAKDLALYRNWWDYWKMEAKGSAGVIARKLLVRLLVAVTLWLLVIAGCFLYSFLHPSLVADLGLALLVLWYIYIPLMWCIVSVAWPDMQRLAHRRF